MKVTLRKFLEIVGTELFITGMCEVAVETLDPVWGTEFKTQQFTWKNGTVRDEIESIENLTPFLDWEIVRFNQKELWGEVDEQTIYLREIKE